MKFKSFTEWKARFLPQETEAQRLAKVSPVERGPNIAKLRKFRND